MKRICIISLILILIIIPTNVSALTNTINFEANEERERMVSSLGIFNVGDRVKRVYVSDSEFNLTIRDTNEWNDQATGYEILLEKTYTRKVEFINIVREDELLQFEWSNPNPFNITIEASVERIATAEEVQDENIALCLAPIAIIIIIIAVVALWNSMRTKHVQHHQYPPAYPPPQPYYQQPPTHYPPQQPLQYPPQPPPQYPPQIPPQYPPQ